MKRWIIIVVCIIGLLGAAAVGGYIYLKPSNPHNVATIGDLPLPFGYKRIGEFCRVVACIAAPRTRYKGVSLQQRE